jgi:hypothetical protein
MESSRGNVELNVLGMPTRCWNCGETTTAVVGITSKDFATEFFIGAFDDGFLGFVSSVVPDAIGGVGEIKDGRHAPDLPPQ